MSDDVDMDVDDSVPAPVQKAPSGANPGPAPAAGEEKKREPSKTPTKESHKRKSKDDKEKADRKKRKSSGDKSKSNSKDKSKDKNKRKDKSKHGKESSKDKDKHRSKAPAPPQVSATVAQKTQRSAFLANSQFRLALPDPPLESKLLEYPFPSDRLIKYCAASLEKSRTFDLLPDRSLGVPIDLIDLEQYTRPPGVQRGALQPEDVPLVADDVKKEKISRIEKLRPESATWLRKTLMLSNDKNAVFYNTSLSDSMKEQKQAIEANRKERLAQSDRSSQLAAIEESFRVNQEVPKHRTNPSLTAVKILPLFPDDDLDLSRYSFITFDAPPAEETLKKISGPAASSSSLTVADMTPEDVIKEFASKSVLLGHPQGHFGLYMPSKKAAPSLPSDVDPQTVVDREHAEWVREYSRRPTPPSDPSENFFFVVTPTAVKYGTYPNRILLRKRTKTIDDPCEDEVASRPSAVTVNLAKPLSSTVDA